MNVYEQKQEAKRERLERAAARARGESDAGFRAARAATAGIPFGQPVLVGHHSEKHHRRALERADAGMRKSVEKANEAAEYSRRAASVGTGGISVDDPDAVEKLTDKRTDLERRRDRMKQVNALYRKGDAAGLAALGLDLETLRAKVAACSWERLPYPPYALTNIGARIRQAKARTDQLEQSATARAELAADPTFTGVETIGTASITQDIEENRVLLSFPERLSEVNYKLVRSHGFVWARTRNAFVRKLNATAVEMARVVARRITGAERPTP